jgi:hypothetical protein
MRLNAHSKTKYLDLIRVVFPNLLPHINTLNLLLPSIIFLCPSCSLGVGIIILLVVWVVDGNSCDKVGLGGIIIVLIKLK